MILYLLLFAVAGFVSGSVLYSKIIPKVFLHKDICELSDDGNPGSFNVFKHCGTAVGLVCLFLDAVKGFIPVVLASILVVHNNFLFSLVVLAPVLGHAVGIFNHFHGGKCIAVSFGVMFGLLPITWIPLAVLAVVYILFSTVIKISPTSKRSIVVYAIFGVGVGVALSLCSLVYIAIGCSAISVVTIIKHLKGIAPLKKEKEYKQ